MNDDFLISVTTSDGDRYDFTLDEKPKKAKKKGKRKAKKTNN